jgi:hypothetical protein
MSSSQGSDYITHYHLTQKQPFLNLSDLSPDELSIVMRDLEDRRAKEELKRVFGKRYMDCDGSLKRGCTTFSSSQAENANERFRTTSSSDRASGYEVFHRTCKRS